MASDSIQVVSLRPAAEPESVERPSAFVRGARKVRAAIGRNSLIELSYRILVAAVGTVLVIVGLIIVPLPGPGWLIVFGGLAVLATEFRGAKRVAHWLRVQLQRFWAWWTTRRAARRARRAARV